MWKGDIFWPGSNHFKQTFKPNYTMFDASQSGYFWGDITSSVDWCEENYAHSPYIAETYNSLSSLVLCFCGIYGIIVHYKYLNAPFLFLYLATVVIGLGSFAFHASLLRESQALDEVPMLYSALSFDFILLSSLYNPTKFYSNLLAIAMICYAIISTLLVTLLTGNAQFYTFHITFGLAAHPGTYLFYLLSLKSKNPMLPSLYRKGLLSILSAVACWFIDLLLCKYVNAGSNSMLPFNPQFHAIWHVGAAICLYYYSMILIVDWIDSSSQFGRGGIVHDFGIFPRVVDLSEKNCHKEE